MPNSYRSVPPPRSISTKSKYACNLFALLCNCLAQSWWSNAHSNHRRGCHQFRKQALELRFPRPNFQPQSRVQCSLYFFVPALVNHDCCAGYRLAPPEDFDPASLLEDGEGTREVRALALCPSSTTLHVFTMFCNYFVIRNACSECG